ncbi:MAG: fibro-slime domain-containing protein [Deltaproteobacteria bacterium]|nr:fibro-slime domain-containing protein [Deltaproteobacteria bacterium]
MAMGNAVKGTLLVVGACLGATAIAVGCGDSGDSSGGSSGGNGAGGTINIGGNAGTGGTMLLDGSAGGDGTGQGGSGGKPPVGCGNVVTGTVRDFHAGVDFQCSGNSGYTDPFNKDCGPWDPAIVGALGSAIGPDRKPVFAGGTKTPSTTSAANFAQWYTDVPGVNLAQELNLTMKAGTSGTFSYETAFFFPIDDKLFAAESNDPDKGPYKSDDQAVRNFHFTYELHTTFRYDVGNLFTFRGDDDVFVYINDKLAVNLGGIHVPLQGTINLDTGRVEIIVDPQWETLVKLHTAPELGYTETIPGGIAGTVALGLTPGEVYNMDFFFAERNCCASNFRMETNFVFVNCGVGPK